MHPLRPFILSVEAFFEMPEELKTRLPQLYNALCDMLNLDPLTKEKIISQAVAQE